MVETAAQYRQDVIRDAFIAGVALLSIRLRLLESENFHVRHTFVKSLKSAQTNLELIYAETYDSSASYNVAATSKSPKYEVRVLQMECRDAFVVATDVIIARIAS